jgi:very-short-patch-repair endonuclease
MGTPDARCGLIAGEQHGCITLAQAQLCGLSVDGVYRRARDARWIRVLPEVYRLAGAPQTWEQKLWAALLWCGEHAVVSGPAASALWELPDSRRGPVEVTHPGSKRSRKGVVVRRMHLDPTEMTAVRGIRVTTPARTLLDLAVRLADRALDAAVHHCLHHRLVTRADLAAILDRRPAGTGSAKLRKAFEAYDVGAPAASPLEARIAHRLRFSGLPAPVRQHEVRVAGRRRFLDFAWPEVRVALEADSYRWHSSRGAWESDRARLRDLRRAGWTIVHATQDDVEGGFDRLAADLADLLGCAKNRVERGS